MQWPLLKKTGIHRLFAYLGRKQREPYFQKIQIMIRERLAQGKHAKQDLFSFTADYLDSPENGGIDTNQLFLRGFVLFPSWYILPLPFLIVTCLVTLTMWTNLTTSGRYDFNGQCRFVLLSI